MVVPVTVAVKITEPPRVGVVVEAAKTTVGVAAATLVPEAEAVAATAL